MAAPFKQAVITAEELERVGRGLFGDQWQSPLARALDMNERSVRYMLSGERGIHAGIVSDLLAIVEAREAELHEIAKVLRRALR
ncbi:MAG: hypothetical protein Q8P46_00275 [Hyphomicrobiales bacterium]|nr:hypothetical protein [Hyphomicrobiales bacterium]